MKERDEDADGFTIFDFAILLVIVVLFMMLGLTKSQLVDLQRRVGQIESATKIKD